jgi:hypothetical protein
MRKFGILWFFTPDNAVFPIEGCQYLTAFDQRGADPPSAF